MGTTPEEPRRRWLRALSAVAALTLVALALLTAGLVVERSRSTASARAADPSGEEVRRVHAVLHEIEQSCSGGPADSRAGERLEANADVLVRFARKYPRARFPIDDESGRALSLLLVAREALLPCAPAAAARVDEALPEEYRKGL